MRPAMEAVIEMTIEFGVSLRTAYRHLKRGTAPAKERNMGKDGKMHPVGAGGKVRSKLERELLLARQALARADLAARANGVQARERELLAEVQKAAAELTFSE